MSDLGEMIEMDETSPEHSLPHYYVNSFSLGISNADFNMTMVRNGAPQAVVNISYTTLKTLAVALSEAVSQLEEATGREIMTVEIVAKALKRVTENIAKANNVP